MIRRVDYVICMCMCVCIIFRIWARLVVCIYNGSHLNDIQHYYYFSDVLRPLLRRFISRCGFNYGFVYPTWASDPIRSVPKYVFNYKRIFFAWLEKKKHRFHSDKEEFFVKFIPHSIIIYFRANYKSHCIFLLFIMEFFFSISKMRKRMYFTKWNNSTRYEAKQILIASLILVLIFCIFMGVFTQ